MREPLTLANNEIYQGKSALFNAAKIAFFAYLREKWQQRGTPNGFRRAILPDVLLKIPAGHEPVDCTCLVSDQGRGGSVEIGRTTTHLHLLGERVLVTTGDSRQAERRIGPGGFILLSFARGETFGFPSLTALHNGCAREYDDLTADQLATLMRDGKVRLTNPANQHWLIPVDEDNLTMMQHLADLEYARFIFSRELRPYRLAPGNWLIVSQPTALESSAYRFVLAADADKLIWLDHH